MFEPGKRNTMVKALSKILNSIIDEIDIGATTIAAAHMNIPVAHIQGGEVYDMQ